jgi:hypothetical protein
VLVDIGCTQWGGPPANASPSRVKHRLALTRRPRRRNRPGVIQQTPDTQAEPAARVAARRKREAEALRENLHRRKQQTRDRADPTLPLPSPEPDAEP